MTPTRIDIVPGGVGVPAYTVTHLRNSDSEFALVIPVINENGRLINQLERIQLAAPDVDIIIADGGSTDGSTDPQRLHKLGVKTLLTKTGSGKLSAQLRMAVHFCLQNTYNAVITMDGNGKDGVAGITAISDSLREGYDFVQGSRFISGGQAINTPTERLLAIRLVHAPLMSLSARRWFTDTTNGFRGHSRRLLEDPRVAPLRDEFDTYELLAYLPIRAARLGYRLTEVPVTRSYPQGGPVPTKIQGVADRVRLLSILLKAGKGCFDPS